MKQTDSPSYAELICKTNYSFLQGGSHAHEVMEQASALKLKALAITDINGVYGIPKAYLAEKDLKQKLTPIAASNSVRASAPNLVTRLIVGAEVRFEKIDPVVFIARDRAAYGTLCRLITAAHADRQKGEAALRWTDFLSLMSHPGAANLLALPTLTLLRRDSLTPEPPLESYDTLHELFGDRLTLPLSRHLDGRDREKMDLVKVLQKRWNSKIVATNDTHTHSPDRRKLQDVITAIREGTTLANAGTRFFSNAERHLKGAREMQTLFRDIPQALHATLEIAETCVFSPSELRYRYPSEWIPTGESAQSYLERLTRQGAQARYAGMIPTAVQTQLDHELKLIAQLGFSDYFLTIWEIVEFARAKKILCQGRGSAANSAVCFCLGITAIDPVRMNLLFERFISAERGEPPDIDVDFEHERREEVIQHIYEKYGRDRAAMVSAVITYRTRSSYREVAKVLDVPHEQARENATVTRLAEELKGFPRHLSIHSGGFTLSADPIIETVPVEPARMEGRTIIQWDKYDLDAIGLLKVDVLALGMLSALHKTLSYVHQSKNGAHREIDPFALLAATPPEDPATYEMIRKADTIGVFQIESRAQMSMLPRLLPKNFYDLVVELAIVRPGPIVGKMVHPYLRRKKGLEPVRLPDARLEPILGRTLGVPLFQEQVMKIAITLAGFTGGEADQLRRAIGAWRSSGSISEIGQKLMRGLIDNGLPQSFADQIFEQIQGFAEYGFPESHAASFALLAYASAYLKCHHPAEFACALINSQPMGFYSNHTLIDDAKRHCVRVLALDPMRSRWDCVMENGALRLGFRIVYGMSRAEADAITRARETHAFLSLADFLSRVAIRKNILNTLAMADAFACFGSDRRHTLWEILASELTTHAKGVQLSLFACQTSQSPQASSAKGTPLFDGLSAYENIRADYSTTGLSVRGHPMQEIRRMRPQLPQITAIQAKNAPNGRSLTVAGLFIVMQRPPTANGTCFATLEDETGFLDLILRKEIYEETRELFEKHSFLQAQGAIQRDGMASSMVVKQILPL